MSPMKGLSGCSPEINQVGIHPPICLSRPLHLNYVTDMPQSQSLSHINSVLLTEEKRGSRGKELIWQRGRFGGSIFHYPSVCLTSQVNRASMFSQTVGDCGSMKPWNEYNVGKEFWTRGTLAILSSKIL